MAPRGAPDRRAARGPALALAMWAQIGIAGLALCVAPAARALEKPADGSTESTPPAQQANDVSGVTPRSSARGFLAAARQGDYARAARYLHLARFPPDRRDARGVELARQLEVVLERALWIDLEAISDDPEGQADDGLPPDHERIGTIDGAERSVPVLLERVSSNGQRIWKFAAPTLAQVPALHEEFGYGELAELLPAIFFEERFLSVQLWQWLGLLVLVLAAWVGSWLAASAAVAVARPLVSRSVTALDDRLLESAIGPGRLGAAVLIFSAGSYALDLSLRAQSLVNGCAQTGGIVAMTWLALRGIDLTANLAFSRLAAEGQSAAWQFVPLGRKAVKGAVLLLALLVTLDSFGFDVTALIAGLGIGGIAVALALQKTLENLFGGATLLVDRPVRVGDFCRFGDQLGTIEEIGIRSTRIRTLDRTVVSVPNAEFAMLQLENYTRRDKIWYHPAIGLRYETTPEQLRHVLSGVREMLKAHSRVDPDGARIRFTKFGAYSLDLEIFAYVKATDYADYLEVAEDLNLRIMDIVHGAGAGFAFPSNTTYLAADNLAREPAEAGGEDER
jgi:MscS family membrane protein